MKKKRHNIKTVMAGALSLSWIMIFCSFTLGWSQSRSVSEESDILVSRASQEIPVSSMNQIISIDFEDVPLLEALKEIAEDLDMKLSYSKEVLPIDKNITADFENTTANEVIYTLLKGTGLRYAISAKGSLVLFEYLGTKQHSAPSDQGVQVVSGIVTDAESGESLPGVNIAIKGTTQGTSTDGDGRYELEVSTLQDTLIFSFVGYAIQEIPVNGRTELDVQLQPQAISGEEMVVVGYGVQRKSDLTGSVSSLQDDEANSAGTVANIDQMLQGRVAGVQVTQASAAPGGGVSVRIRGINSVNTDSEPLYVIDGQPINKSAGPTATGEHFGGGTTPSNPLNALNPQDIASVEVLKDASAAAIYGARGANGVVLITTKQGSGDLKVDVSSSIGIQNIANKLDLLSTNEYINVMNNLEMVRGNSELFSESDVNSIGTGTDWQDEIFRTAATSKNTLSLSGQEGNSSYHVSLNYMKQNGIIMESNFKRINGKLNYEFNKDKFGFGLNLTTARIDENIVAGGGSINYMAGAVNHAINTPPIFSVYNQDGEYVRPYEGTNASVSLDNPIAVAKEIDNLRTTNRTFGNVFAEYDVLPNLLARVRFGADWQNIRSDAFRNTNTFRGAAFGGVGQIKEQGNTSYLFESTLNYQNSFNKHSIDLLAGFTYEDFETNFLLGETQGFPSDVIGTNDLSTGTRENHILDSNKFLKTLISYLGRANYNFANRYLLTASVRVDGSSNFGANNKFAVFPSFAAAWRPLEESFVPDSDVLTDFKIRASWGITGNDQIGLGQSITTYSNSGNVLFGEDEYTAIRPTRIANPDLKWESTTQINFGLDYGLFDQRITGSVEYFKKNTKNMLLNLPIPNTTGYDFITENVGEVQNSGLELSLETRNITREDFMWSTSLNFSTLNNEVKDLGPLSRITQRNGSILVQPGEPIFSYYGFEAKGIFQEGDDIANSAQPAAEPGYVRWNDVNNDGEINDQDRVNLGDPFPDYTFGIGNSFSYKNFNLNVFIEAAQGQELLNYGIVNALFPNDPFRNRLAKPLLNRWTPENATNEWPSSVDPNAYLEGEVNSFTVEDASLIRLKNVQLSYDIPVDRFNLRSARVFINGDNLVLLTDYMGFDPDVNTRGQDNIRIDRNAYPRARTVTVGVNLGF